MSTGEKLYQKKTVGFYKKRRERTDSGNDRKIDDSRLTYIQTLRKEKSRGNRNYIRKKDRLKL